MSGRRRLRSENAHRNSPRDFQHLHDLRVVRTPAPSQHYDDRGNSWQLGDRARRILFPSPGESPGLRQVHWVSVEDHSRSDHAGGVRDVRVPVSRRTHALELSGIVCVSGGCGGLRVLEITAFEPQRHKEHKEDQPFSRHYIVLLCALCVFVVQEPCSDARLVVYWHNLISNFGVIPWRKRVRRNWYLLRSKARLASSPSTILRLMH